MRYTPLRSWLEGMSMANVAILVTLEQILAAIHSLPAKERRQLLDSLSKDVGPPATAEPKPLADVEPADFIGFLAGDPDLADEIERIGTVGREREEMRAWDDLESRP
jgi:hypothetical protein